MHLGLVFWLALAQPAALHPDFVALLTPFEQRYTGSGYHDELVRYRLFVPAMSARDQKWPLIVWLHGYGEAGSDNVSHLEWLEKLVFSAPWDRTRFPFFLLAVQCPRDNAAWTRHDASPEKDDMIDVAKDVIDRLLREYPVDPRRIYLCGVSSGGTGCWEFAIRYPEYFAAVTPLASQGTASPYLDRLTGVPVWVFHCKLDGGIPEVRNTVAALRDAGGRVHLTEINSTLHDCWTPAFEEFHLLDWMLAQKQGQALESNRPGVILANDQRRSLLVGWEWWQICVQAGIVVAFFAFPLLLKKSRRPVQSASSPAE